MLKLCRNNVVELDKVVELDNVIELNTELDTDLQNETLNIKSLPPFIPPVQSGRVIKVYDGDTITIATRIPGLKASPIYKLSVRLNGIDTPEMRTKNEEEKMVARMAQVALSNKIMNKMIILKDVKTEKYGRLLAELYLGDEHINKWLLDNRYAIQYGGGTKVIPKSWLLYHKEGII